MKSILCGMVAAGALTAQTLAGPVLGYVVDRDARMRPLYGTPASAHVGAAVRDGVRETWGGLALLQDGTAVNNGTALEGQWTKLEPGAFVDASGRELLVAGESAAAWRLTLPDGARAVRVSASGEHVLTLLADESVAMWSKGGKADFRIAASQWWGLAFAGERPVAYDPAEHSLFWLDGPGGMTLLRKLDGAGGTYSLAVDRAARTAVLLGEKALVIPMGEGDVRELDVPEGTARLEALLGGKAFLLMRDPSKPIWILDPAAAEPLLVVPAMSETQGGQQ